MLDTKNFKYIDRGAFIEIVNKKAVIGLILKMPDIKSEEINEYEDDEDKMINIINTIENRKLFYQLMLCSDKRMFPIMMIKDTIEKIKEEIEIYFQK